MGLNANSFASGGGEGNNPIPIGSHVGRLVQVVDKGIQARQPYQGQAKDPIQMIILTFELPFCRINVEGVDKPRWFSVVRNASTHAKAGLTKDLKVLDPTGAYGGDLSKMLGTPVILNVVQKTDSAGQPIDGTKIESIAPLVQGMQVPNLENPPRVFDFDNPSMEVYLQLPEWLRTDILKALNFPGSKVQAMLQANQGQGQVASAAQAAPQGYQAPPQANPMAQGYQPAYAAPAPSQGVQQPVYPVPQQQAYQAPAPAYQQAPQQAAPAAQGVPPQGNVTAPAQTQASPEQSAALGQQTGYAPQQPMTSGNAYTAAPGNQAPATPAPQGQGGNGLPPAPATPKY